MNTPAKLSVRSLVGVGGGGGCWGLGTLSFCDLEGVVFNEPGGVDREFVLVNNEGVTKSLFKGNVSPVMFNFARDKVAGLNGVVLTILAPTPTSALFDLWWPTGLCAVRIPALADEDDEILLEQQLSRPRAFFRCSRSSFSNSRNSRSFAALNRAISSSNCFLFRCRASRMSDSESLVVSGEGGAFLGIQLTWAECLYMADVSKTA